MTKRIVTRIVNAYRMRKRPVSFARSIGVAVGENCRFYGINAGTFGSEPYLIRIGDHVTITSGVRFITHDGGVWVFRQSQPDIDVFGPIVVGSNVFIGIGAIILPNVTIGDDCVIGLGAVVTRSVPSGSVVAGVPARTIKTVEEYWRSVQPKASFIRSLPREKKRALLLQHFFPGQEQSHPISPD